MDCELSKQIGIDQMLGVLFAGVWALVDGLQAHVVHKATNTMPSCRKPRLRKIGRDLAAPQEWVFSKYPVDLMHKITRLSVHANWCVRDG